MLITDDAGALWWRKGDDLGTCVGAGRTRKCRGYRDMASRYDVLGQGTAVTDIWMAHNSLLSRILPMNFMGFFFFRFVLFLNK